MRCPKCKKQLREGAKFCPACGAKVQKRTAHKISLVFLIIALVICIIAAGWGIGTLIARYSEIVNSRVNVSRNNLTNSGNDSDVKPYHGVVSSGECYSPKNENIVYEDAENSVGYVNNMVLVFFSSDASQDDILQVVENIDGCIVGKIEGINQYQIEIEATSKEHLKSICTQLETNPIVKFAVIDYVFSSELNTVSAPNDPWKDTFQGIWGVNWDENSPGGTNWWFEAAKILSAWSYSDSFTTINVGVVDNGYDTNHEDLNINVINNHVNSIENHGTHVAGIIGATVNNAIGISGIIDQVNLFGVDCYATSKQEHSNITVSSLMSGIVSCLDNNCKVINMSSGTKYTKKDETKANASDSAHVAIQYLIAMLDTYDDFIIVQSAGNGDKNQVGVDALEYNGYFSSVTVGAVQQVLDEFANDGVVLENEISAQDVLDSIIIVGAVDKKKRDGQYQLAEFSNYGSAITVCAPGVDIFSTLVTGGIDGNYGNLSGTSMAAPIVAGTTAMVWSVDQSMSAAEVKAIIIETATEQVLSRNKKDAGTYYIVNASAAVERAVEKLRQKNGVLGGTGVFSVYLNAAKKTVEAGTWAEHLTMTADMTITDGSAKTKTKMTMTSDADISNYSESDPSRVNMSGTAEMSVMGQTYAWNMQYENGMAHYQYTKPNQTSADIAIDPSFFNFSIITSDMMTNAKMSGNQITFTVPGDKITEAGIAAVNQMSGVDDLNYGDVDVAVTISNEGTIDTITMVFHASLKYQGYDADVDYDITYRFSKSTAKATSGNISIQPGYYVQDGNELNTLTVHAVSGNSITFSVWWYRIWDISNAKATGSGNTVTFDYTAANNASLSASGSIAFSEDTATLTLTDCTDPYVDTGDYRFKLIGRIFTEEQLAEIKAALGVPENLDVEISQGEPVYWEGGGFYRTYIEILHNGEMVASANVHSLTGALAGSIYIYSGSESTPELYASGNCGDALVWSLTTDGTLTISGNGDMYGYPLGDSSVPWLNGQVPVTSVVFSGNITSIGEYAFCKTSIENISIPASVTVIGYAALDYIDTLEGIWVDGGNPVYSSDDSGVLFDKVKTTLIAAPTKLKGTYTVPTTVTWIYDAAFSDCSGITTVNWPASVSRIGQGAFSGCSELEYICIPGSVTAIEPYTFYACLSMTGIRIPEGITSIGWEAFGECPLKDVFYGGTNKQWKQLMENCSDNTISGANVYELSY